MDTGMTTRTRGHKMKRPPRRDVLDCGGGHDDAIIGTRGSLSLGVDVDTML